MPKTSKTVAIKKTPLKKDNPSKVLSVKKVVESEAKKTEVKKVAKAAIAKKSSVGKKKEAAVKKAPTKTKTVKKEVPTAKTASVKKGNAGTKSVAEKKNPIKKVSTKSPAKSVKKVIPSVLDTIVDAMWEKKAQQVVSLDFAAIDTAICNYFVICNADSAPQVNAIVDSVEDQMFKKTKQWPIRCQGKENGFWVIMDYGDFIVHIFQTEYRKFYRLEELWADAKITWHKEI